MRGLRVRAKREGRRHLKRAFASCKSATSQSVFCMHLGKAVNLW